MVFEIFVVPLTTKNTQQIHMPGKLILGARQVYWHHSYALTWVTTVLH